ncbi:MAG: histidine kinase [Panacagrimonas sp.]|nr:response regulator [Panacagrimonas sp.]MCC2654938.1 histidine kinase [Panacagrimonas sp.]
METSASTAGSADAPMQVLLLEDDARDAELTCARLELSLKTVEVTVVDDETSFRHALGSRDFDVILADFNLPSFSGSEALSIARELHPVTPFILMSGSLGEERALDLLYSGATDFVGKQRLDKLPLVVERARTQLNETRTRLAAERALQETEIQYRLLVDALKDYVVIGLDAAGLIRSSNAAAGAILGVTPDSLIGRPVSALFESIAEAEHLERAANDGSVIDERWVRTPGGRTLFASIVTTAIREPYGTLIGYSKIIRDMTAARQTADALQLAKDEASRDLAQRKIAENKLREANERKSQFLAILAHELRNPLAPIRTSLDALRIVGDDPALMRRLRAGMERQVGHMVRLIDDLLDLSRIDHGRIRLEREPIDLVSILRSAVEASTPLMQAREHAFTLRLPPEEVLVEADPVRIAQVFSNLLNNAASYTKPGGHIEVSLKHEGDAALIRVRDNGIGIPPEMRQQIFEPFMRVSHAGGNQGGLGIGLAICRELMTMHGGTIEARSEGPGKGSEFVVRLPLLPIAMPAQVTSPVPQPDRPTRVLIVDDNRDAAEALRVLLVARGHEVRAVFHGQDVLPLLSSFRPEVLLVDLGMPDIDGFEVCRQVRREAGGDRAPLMVALTGWGQEQDRLRSRDAGFDLHLVKPVGADELESAFAHRSCD